MRKEIKSRIAALDKEYIIQSDRAIFEKIITLPEFISAPRVFVYLSIGREPDTRALIRYCWAQGKIVAIPHDYKKDGVMCFALLDRPIEALQSGTFGIPVLPDEAERLVPRKDDIIIVPALCFDENAYRLGRGGGYYDRYLAEHRVFSVGLCREKLLLSAVPRDAYDRRTDAIITDKRIARPE